MNGLGGTQANLVAPTFIRTAMTAGFSHSLEEAGVKVGEVADVVQAILRAVVDDEVDGKLLFSLLSVVNCFRGAQLCADVVFLSQAEQYAPCQAKASQAR